ncbi:MAG: ABC transporter ATP-binding protein [Silvanigrellales bacterium]|nr:ABC transporter ATP-binding protein [Silvanigrellales bacterium]
MALSLPVVSARGLVKAFGSFTAVKGLDLEVHKGECFGLLGPNGAGKSTFIGMTYGSVARTSGDLSVFGLDPRKSARAIKKRLGVVTQDNALDESLSVRENMRLYAAFVGTNARVVDARIVELLEYMNLAHKADAPIGSLSGGMKRRLVFVRALLCNPDLLILDEPTTGLDPAVRHLLWGKVRELHAKGTTILLTTHYMHEAEVLCDRIVIMNRGEVSGHGSPRELIAQYAPGFVGLFDVQQKARVTEALSVHRAEKRTAPAPLETSSDFTFHEDASMITVRGPTLESLSSFCSARGLVPSQLRPSNLEDVFLKLTGQGLSDDA